MRAVFPLEFRVGRRGGTTRLVALVVIAAAVVACSQGSDAGRDTGATRTPAGSDSTRAGAASRTFAIHDGHCVDHAKVIEDVTQRRNFLADCQDRIGSVTRASTAFMLAGEMMLTIPEYHDEQELPIAADAYGPLARFFASPFLGTFTRPWQIEEQGKRGFLAGIVDVTAPDGTDLPAQYDSLNLAAGMNCLWLALVGGEWKASISHAPPKTACDPDAQRDTLGVTATQDDIGERHYPAVARFTEAARDATGDLPTAPGLTLLSVRCLDKWCEIGPRNADGTTKFHRGKPLAGMGTRERRIKGWHDEQWLAVKDAGTGKLKPAFRAAFIPAQNINNRSADSFEQPQDRWTLVATVVLTAPPPLNSKYEKIGLRNGENRLMIRRKSGVWEGQWTYEGGLAPKAVTIHRIQHYDAAVPGTARFRWQSNDDSMWAACGQACCRVEPAS